MISVIRFTDEYDLNNQLAFMNIHPSQIISIVFNQLNYTLECYFIQQ